MAVASPPFPLGHTDPIPFSFGSRNRVKAQVRFYSDAEGMVAIAKGSGTRDVAASTFDYVVSTDLSYIDPALDSDYADGTQTLTGGVWAEFGFADGATRASFACSGGGDPIGAASFKVLLSISKEVP